MVKELLNQIPGPYRFVWYDYSSKIKIFWKEAFIGSVYVCDVGPNWITFVCREEEMYDALVLLNKHKPLSKLAAISGSPEDTFAQKYFSNTSYWRDGDTVTNLYVI